MEVMTLTTQRLFQPAMKTSFEIIAIVAGLLLAAPSPAANITMNGTDAAGTSSFNTGLHWTGGAAPTGGNAYFTGAYTLRTPSSSGSYAFAGDSLSIDAGGSMNLKTSPGTLTFNNLILNGGKMANGQGAVTLAGNITVAANSTLDTQTRNTTNSAAISGTYNLTELSLSGGGGTVGSYTLNVPNPFSGQWIINDASNSVGLVAVLVLGEPNALQNGTLSLTTTSINSLKFGPGIGTFTLGGLAGTGSFALTDTASGAITLQVGNNNGSTTYAGGLSGVGGNVTKLGNGTLTLNGTNTYTGATTLSAGTLALGSKGSISNSSSISIAAGATCDVSAIANFTFPGTNFSASGTGTTPGTSAAAITGGATVSLGTQPITLTYDGSHPALYVPQGTLVLNSNTFIINTSSALAQGTYPLIQQAAGSIDGTGPYACYATTAIGPNSIGYIAVVGGTVNLVIVAAGAPVNLALISGNHQQAGLGKRLLSPLVVKVTSGNGLPVSGVDVTFAITSAPVGATGQSLSVADVTTDGNGLAASALTLGNLSGTYTVTASASGLVPVTFTAACAAIAKAATGTDLTVGGSWTSGGVPDSTNVATWVSSSLGAGLTLGTSASWSGLDVEGALSDVAITGAGTLTLGANGIDMSASPVNVSLGNPLVLGDNQIWAVNTGVGLTVSGVITGSGVGLTLPGGGTVTLSGANTYSGATTLGAGTLALAGSGAVSQSAVTLSGASAVLEVSGITAGTQIGSLSGASGSTLSLGSASLAVGGLSTSTTFSGNIQDDGAGNSVLNKVGSGTLTLDGFNSYSGTTTISAGTLQIGAGDVTGAIGTGPVNNNAILAFNLSGPLEVDAAIAGSGALQQLGAGTTMLTGANTYGGGTTLKAGELSIGEYANLPATGLLTFNGGTLQVTGIDVTNLDPYTVNWSSFNGGFDVNNNANTLTVTNVIGGSGSLNKVGSGMLLLAASNSFSGGLTFSGATLTAGAAGALGNGFVTGSNNAVLQFNTLGNATFTNAMNLAARDYNSIVNNSSTSTITLNGNIANTGGNFFTFVGQGASAAGFVLGGSNTINLSRFVIKNASVTLANNNAASAPNFPRISLGDSGGTNAAVYLLDGITQAQKVVDANNNDINGSTFTVGMTTPGTSTFSGAAAGNVAVDLHVRSTGGANTAWNFEADAGATVKFTGAIVNTGSNVNAPLTKIGSGTVIFSGVNTYAGSTLINNGTLTGVVGGSCANSDVTVAATAGNTATLDVSVTNNTSQWTCASLTVNSAGASSGLQFDFGALTPSATVPPLNLTGSVTFATAPAVTISGSSLPVSTGDGYPLLTWGNGPAPSLGGVALTLPSGIEGSLASAGSTLYLQISRGTPPNTPTNISYSVTGTTLTISWPASYLGWILQSQTNVLSVGLKKNWYDVSGSGSISSTNLPINPVNPSVFYRLRHP